MERLDFASVMTVLRRNINEDLCPNQLELVETLFCDMGSSPESCMEFDNGLVCRWINGLAKLSPKITAHYQENRNQQAGPYYPEPYPPHDAGQRHGSAGTV